MTNRQRLIPVLPRSAWAVLGGDFVSAIGVGLTLPCLFIYAHQVRDLSYGQAGLVLSTIALTSLAGNPIGGAAADRWTPRLALIIGLLLAAAGSAALAAARSAPELFGAAALCGLGVSITWPVQDTLLAGLAGPDSRSAVFSVGHACLNAGLGLGALGSAGIVSVGHPGTFTAVFLADAGTYLVPVVILARLRLPEPAQADQQESSSAAPWRGYLAVLRDKAFVRVWLLTALIVTVSFGQYQSSFAGFTTRPGGISTHGLALAYAANMLTVVFAQLFVLRWLSGRRRTTGAALAAIAWAVTWIVVLIGGHLGGGPAAIATFAVAMVIFALGETMLSPTLPAIVNDLAPAGSQGRYNGLGVLAFTTGFLLGPAVGGAALGAGQGNGLFAVIAAVCILASLSALRLARHLPAAANRVTTGVAGEPIEASDSASARTDEVTSGFEAARTS
jgi:MFS family permease